MEKVKKKNPSDKELYSKINKMLNILERDKRERRKQIWNDFINLATELGIESITLKSKL